MEIRLNDSVLFYEKHGLGPNTLLLFHGFGQDHSSLSELTSSLANDYTCYSFDLFFHGRSRWSKHDQPIILDEWKEFILQFLARENITQFDIFGYSIGARFALATFQSFPEKAGRIILVAPDVFENSIWYSLAVTSPLARRLFKRTTQHPGLFNTLTKWSGRVRSIDRGTRLFAQSQMSSQEKRAGGYK